MAKRKATSPASSPNTQNKRPRTRATSKADTSSTPTIQGDASTATTQTPFPFLALPAELRTHILELAAADHGTGLLKRTSRGVLGSRDPISLVNKQLREEYLGVLYAHASVILAHVLDFDFRHVVTFFNKLSVSEVRALPGKKDEVYASKSVDSPPNTMSSGQTIKIPLVALNELVDAAQPTLTPTDARKIKILLDFNPKFDAKTSWLNRWLRRFSATEKVGVNADIEYEAYSTEAVTGWTGRNDWQRIAWILRQGALGVAERKKIEAAVAWANRGSRAMAKPMGFRRRIICLRGMIRD